MKSNQGANRPPIWKGRFIKIITEEQQAFALTGLFALVLVITLCTPVFSRDSWLVFVQDDLLYYLKVAQNIAGGYGSTFNEITNTNGYQPLWLMILVVLSWMTAEPRTIMAFLVLSNLLAALTTFVLVQKLLRTSGIGPVLVFVFSAWVTLYAVTLFFYGMETTLTVPLMLGVICLMLRIAWIQESWMHSLAFGCLLSAMVLSRIDTLIFGALILCGILVDSSLRKCIRADLVVGLIIGLLPVALYFLFNHYRFHTWLPISGMAKELKSNHFPSIEPWRVFFHPLAGMVCSLVLCAMAMLYLRRSYFDSVHKVIFAATLLFPFLYYFVLSCVSDWTLWGWYMYPIRSAVCVSFVIVLSWHPVRRLADTRAARLVLVASVFACLIQLRWTRQQTDIYAASLEIQEFAKSHPGIYAMGDRAGRVGYLIPNPVIQTEGLMMDRDYLRYVERQTPLREILARYNVRYYIATAYEPYSGCFQAVEPAKAGPSSAKMRAVFCRPAEAVYLHNGVETLIFDLAKE